MIIGYYLLFLIVEHAFIVSGRNLTQWESQANPGVPVTTSLLVSPFCVLLVGLGHRNYLGNSHRVQLPHGLVRKSQLKVAEDTLVPLIQTRQRTHLPRQRVPRETPSPPRPTLGIMHPPPRIEQLIETYIFEGAVGQIAIPLVLDLGDLPSVLVIGNSDLARDCLLLVDALHDIAGFQIHLDGVAARGDLMVEALDLAEGCLKTVPLRFVLGTASSDGDGIFEQSIVVPHLKLLQRRSTGEELWCGLACSCSLIETDAYI